MRQHHASGICGQIPALPEDFIFALPMLRFPSKPLRQFVRAHRDSAITTSNGVSRLPVPAQVIAELNDQISLPVGAYNDGLPVFSGSAYIYEMGGTSAPGIDLHVDHRRDASLNVFIDGDADNEVLEFEVGGARIRAVYDYGVPMLFNEGYPHEARLVDAGRPRWLVSCSVTMSFMRFLLLLRAGLLMNSYQEEAILHPDVFPKGLYPKCTFSLELRDAQHA